MLSFEPLKALVAKFVLNIQEIPPPVHRALVRFENEPKQPCRLLSGTASQGLGLESGARCTQRGSYQNFQTVQAT